MDVRNQQLKKKLRVSRSPTTDVTTLQDLVTLLHLQLLPFLTPLDLSCLLLCLSFRLQSPFSEFLATCGLRTLFERNSVHFGRRCRSDWHLLVLKEAEGCEGPCDVCKLEAPSTELRLPRILHARVHLLEASCLALKGFTAVCNGVLQMHFGEYADISYGSMQPVVVSLSVAIEKQRQEKKQMTGNKKKKAREEEQDEVIDTEDVAQLTRLLDTIHLGFGTHFFSNRKQNCTPTNAVEAHWRNIDVDLETEKTTCHYCEFVAVKSFCHECEGCSHILSSLLQQHCKALYQPLKLFMTRHLKHVRYVKALRGWNCAHDEFRGNDFMDLIAGFTPQGVLCGVYLTELRIRPEMIADRLALGAIKL